MPTPLASPLRALRWLAVAIAIMTAVPPSAAEAASASEIDTEVDAALETLFSDVPEARALAENAAGVLVFPRIVKGGFVVGFQGGQGALRREGRTVGYYETGAASFGLQAGVQTFGYALFFMSEDDLAYLDRSEGFELGSAPSLTIVDKGVAATLSTTTLREGIVAVFFSPRGLMAGLGLQGSRIERIDPED